MKIFVFTYDRYDTLTTPMLLDQENIPYTVLCHSEQDRDKFIAAGRIKGGNIIATGKPKGLTYNRNYALEMMPTDEWAMFLVDDYIETLELDDYDIRVSDILNVTTTNSSAWGRKFKKLVTMATLLKRAEECIQFAERFGIKLIGFAGNDNPLFRAEKWKFNTLADGRCWLIKKSDLYLDEHVQLIDDVCFTAQNLQKFGKVLVNQWVLPLAKRYTKGGFGSIAERMEQRKAECKYLVETYKPLVVYANKAGWPAGAHVRIHTPKLK